MFVCLSCLLMSPSCPPPPVSARLQSPFGVPCNVTRVRHDAPVRTLARNMWVYEARSKAVHPESSRIWGRSVDGRNDLETDLSEDVEPSFFFFGLVDPRPNGHHNAPTNIGLRPTGTMNEINRREGPKLRSQRVLQRGAHLVAKSFSDLLRFKGVVSPFAAVLNSRQTYRGPAMIRWYSRSYAEAREDKKEEPLGVAPTPQ
ncbi:hypothetical protein EV702DRAFT_1268668 [Suillus placidus]|uniref:Uncharacterized protein n=1 Tax=Suillus placidus TaxID=48579 RepID=A0A9P7D275_9AGAM|nr:hypothetical protein EV702DRAFT_1268668 [Suillus placidus]